MGVEATTFLSRMLNIGENRYRIVYVIPKRKKPRNLHISRIRVLFPVSFNIEYKVCITDFYLYMGFGG